MAHDIYQAEKVRVILNDVTPLILVEVDGVVVLRASSSSPLEVVDQRVKRDSVLTTSLPPKTDNT